MASETKVGLLVGLAFIVCFAVILANRGREERISAQVPYSLLAPPPSSPLAPPPDENSLVVRGSYRQSPASRGADHLVPARRVASLEDPRRDWSRTGGDSSHRATPTQPPARREPAAGVRRATPPDWISVPHPREWDRDSLATNGIDDPSRKRADADRALANSRMVGQSIAGLRRSAETGAHSANDRTASTRPPVDRPKRDSSGVRRAAPTGEDTRRLQALVDRTAPASPPALPKKTHTPARAVSGKKYTVVAGDNLYRIARKHYGAGSPKWVRTIFQANRTVLSNEDELRVGDELFLPDVDRQRASAGPARSSNGKGPREKSSGSSATPPRRRGSRPFRWYQIEKNDRYTTIAAAQLGDSRRWKELYELNRDIFPDPDRIRAGVRIRIPTVKVADARGGRP